jgi:hypothetical protein
MPRSEVVHSGASELAFGARLRLWSDLSGLFSRSLFSGCSRGSLSRAGISLGLGAFALGGARGGLRFFGATLLFGGLLSLGVQALLTLRNRAASSLGALELLVEALDLTGRIHNALLARVKRVAHIAKVNAKSLTG